MVDTLEVDKSFVAECADIPRVVSDNVVQMPNPADGTVQPQSPLPSSALTPEALEMAFGMLFDMIAMGIGTGGEFWQLKPLERSNLAKAWLPIVGPLLDAWGISGHAPLVMACLMTAATLGPRLQLEKKRRESAMVDTATEKFGDSSSLQDQPAAANPEKPIDLSSLLSGA